MSLYLLSLWEIIDLSLVPLAVLVANLSKNYYIECMRKGVHLLCNRAYVQSYINFWNCFELVITFHICLQNQVTISGKLWRVKIIFLTSCPGDILQLCLVKCSARHIHLFIKVSKHSSFLVDFSCCPDHSSETFIFPCNDGIHLFSILKALLVSFFPIPFQAILFHTKQIQQNQKIFHCCLTL